MGDNSQIYTQRFIKTSLTRDYHQLQSITTKEFEQFRRFIHSYAGIDLVPAKKVMVGSRLAKRVSYYQCQNYSQYYDIAMKKGNSDEFQVLVNILTTNETYFFREPKHFDFLREKILKNWKNPSFRLWSAASSSGEEAYSIAMELYESLGARKWEILGTDLSTKVVHKAQTGLYLMDRIELLDENLLKKYCLKGVRSQEGTFLMDDKLKKRTRFKQYNLMNPLPQGIGMFDVIFLRNVLIYFDTETKKQIVERLINALKPGGYFFISHSETLSRVTDKIKMIQPSIYQK